MLDSEWDAFRDRFLADVKDLLYAKGNDYSGEDVDRLANFKATAASAGVEPLQVWLVYVMKHLASVRSYADGVEQRTEPIRSRFLDLAAYAALGAALAQDETTGRAIRASNALDAKGGR